jgi:hypothetical protein
MKTLSLAFVLLLGSTAIAHAENFTFTSKGTSIAQVGGPGPAGKPVAAGHSKTETEITWASGSKTTSKGECMGWSAPPTSGFSNQGMCTATDSDGSKSFLQFTCVAVTEKTADCWGRLTGLSGKWQGKLGTASWRSTQNPDGKGGSSVGAGTLN